MAVVVSASASMVVVGVFEYILRRWLSVVVVVVVVVVWFMVLVESVVVAVVVAVCFNSGFQFAVESEMMIFFYGVTFNDLITKFCLI